MRSLRRREPTVRHTRIGMKLEDFPQLVPLYPDDFRPPWDLMPQPPFRVQAWHEMNEVGPVSWTSNNLDRVMRGAVQTLGPGAGAAMVVLDEGFHVVFGYTAISAVLVEFGSPMWYGCRLGYEWLECNTQIPSMDLAVWESTAKDRAR